LAATDNKTAPEKHFKTNPANRGSGLSSGKQSGPGPFVLSFLILAFFWILFSGKFDLFHLSLGIISCLIVSAVSHKLLYPDGVKPKFLIFWLRFAGYIPWLLYQIFLANLQVLYIVFHPRMKDLINPQIIEFNSRLKSDVSRTTFANSITLTPGTITVSVSVMGKFAVHCINDKAGQSLPGEMEDRVGKVFSE
jgi:multicomponent Na+:H+ antiporter subunit E